MKRRELPASFWPYLTSLAARATASSAAACSSASCSSSSRSASVRCDGFVTTGARRHGRRRRRARGHPAHLVMIIALSARCSRAARRYRRGFWRSGPRGDGPRHGRRLGGRPVIAGMPRSAFRVPATPRRTASTMTTVAITSCAEIGDPVAPTASPAKNHGAAAAIAAHQTMVEATMTAIRTVTAHAIYVSVLSVRGDSDSRREIAAAASVRAISRRPPSTPRSRTSRHRRHRARLAHRR